MRGRLIAYIIALALVVATACSPTTGASAIGGTYDAAATMLAENHVGAFVATGSVSATGLTTERERVAVRRVRASSAERGTRSRDLAARSRGGPASGRSGHL